ncbi:MAG TPA: hypothetical protein VGH28_29845 [Polyangiaceae bacterium]
MGRRGIEQTAAPARNFTLTTAERVGAIVTGAPAWARRRKSIEDLSVQIVELHRAGEARLAKKKLAELVKLVQSHNTYYPIEANLPLDPETSQLLELGEPWKPMPTPTLESLLEEAAARERSPTSLAWSDEPDALVVSFDATDGERFIVRLDEVSLSCATGAGEVSRVATADIEEFGASRTLEIVTHDARTVRLPFLVEESALATLVRELGARLRAIRAATADYRGAT